jgi:PleD family two-component response regulator
VDDEESPHAAAAAHAFPARRGSGGETPPGNERLWEKGAPRRSRGELAADPYEAQEIRNTLKGSSRMDTDAGVPPVVLLVGLQNARDPSYCAALTEAGFWVAESASLQDALRDIVDLRPDVVIADLTTNTTERQPQEFVRTLKANPATGAVPVVVLEDAADAQRPLRELGPLDMRVPKPVSPPALRSRVDHVLAASRGLRQRVAQSPAVHQSNRLERTTESLVRTCPSCAGRLVWADRSVLGAIEYDYFRWCASGCGLYCFDRAAQQWLKLA